MSNTSYSNMSDKDIERKRDEIYKQIEGLQKTFIALGIELDTRIASGKSVKSPDELQAEINALKAQLDAQQPQKVGLKTLFVKAKV